MRKALVRYWREFNSEPLIANSVTLTVIVLLLIYAAMMAVMLASMAWIFNDFNGRAIDAILFGWPAFAVITGFGALRLMFYQAGISPDRAFETLFKFIGAVAVIYLIVVAGQILLLVIR